MARPRNLARRAEQQAVVIEAVAMGRSVRSTGIRWKQVLEWQAQDEQFRELYARARAAQLARWADDLVEIADDPSGDPNRDRLRIDTRKWLLARMLPRLYGDRVVVAGDEAAPVVIRDDAQRAQRIEQLLATARARITVSTEPQEPAQSTIGEPVDSDEGGQ